eukprot:TRINITY_DN62784_c0_g1_i1.p1 TRINITY_DN62784_c0_g1~~TRINITY_DN62784_c0_g1_i1.p1  ORF type:complete len:312 (+),score=33.62 TRINITY_DN62784_c0_g1_i1:44-979(+)
MMSTAWCLQLLSATVFCAHVKGSETHDGTILTTIEYVWPLLVLQTNMVPDDVKQQAAFQKLRAEIADVGAKGFASYTDSVLPKELDRSPEFAAWFENADASRYNLGFFRWQKRVFAQLTRIPYQEILWDGNPVPKLKGVDYTWPAFHNGFQSIKQDILGVVNSYAQQGGIAMPSGRLRFIPWVEVYRPNEFQHPHTHTGSPFVGMFAASCEEASQSVTIEDPRGINPPFGRKQRFVMQSGDLIIFPSWASHFLEPNRGTSTNVFVSFAIQGEGGPQEFDWEDDGLGNVVKSDTKMIKKKSSKRSGTERNEL